MTIINHYLNDDNASDAINVFQKCVQAGVRFKLRENILKSSDFHSIYNKLSESMPQEGENIESLIEKIELDMLPYCTNFSSPYAMAFPDAGNSIAALSAAILSDFINQNLINWSPCSPVGTIIEIIVINWLRELVGFSVIKNPSAPSDVGGIVTSGGVASNVIAQLLARENAFPGTMKKGVKSINQEFISIVPDGIEHYSSRLSMGWLGLGEENVVRVKTKHFKYDINALLSTIKKEMAYGKKIISITAYAGDSRSMTCDNFIRLSQICREYGIWFHVDACHGTQLLFSQKYKSKVSGIELADSITFDPHKVLNIPYALSLILLKDPSHLEPIQRPEDIITGEEHSFGQITPFFGSRPFQSLKLYMLIKHLGREGLSSVIEQRCEMAQGLAAKIKASSHFILINPTIDINSVIFMYCPEKLRGVIKASCTKHTMHSSYIESLNLLNSRIQQNLLDSGDIWLHNFNIPDSSNIFGLGSGIMLRPLRFMSGNPNISMQSLDIMLNKVRECGEKLIFSILGDL